MLVRSRRDFYFWKIDISGNFRHVHFGKHVDFFIFGHFPDGGGGDDVPRTLPSGQTPGPSRAGSKYPVQGIPHFDVSVRIENIFFEVGGMAGGV